jgi:hypothetical protein
MKEVFYNDLTLEKDLKFCAYMQELEDNPEVIIMSHGEKALVHEMKTDPRHGYARPRIDTGVTHVGFYSHWVFFYYRGKFYYVQPSDYYPFTDENHPGMFNFVPYIKGGSHHGIQSDYMHAYYGLASIDEYKPETRRAHRPLPGVDYKTMDFMIPYGAEKKIDRIVKTYGGVREKEIWEEDPVSVRSETWNREHMVLNILSPMLDESGHHNSFSVDLITGTICG